ncbi:MAG: class I SAM-dependent RNA methyltransferase [Candidatus Omnitrophica bacterium]|nr:class I SAM-dependent RNA methyltransferase [Candidatus Omnitrophota bacterium]MBU1996363.1 class I SAM-dependent RNA methyltransferase [Candidatus Omnitrophota bacterium]MBU4333211.1 class I SAM-dependent RNA methyltransferase [Candidatus Omnitrophota bacterium]
MKNIKLIVTSTFGFESVVKKELIALGFDHFIVSDGKIEFDAAISDIPKLNIWLRAADRVLIKIGEFHAADFDALFDQTKSCPWNDWINENSKITVIGKSVKSTLQSVRSNQSMVKRAIIKKMQETYNKEMLPETGPEFVVQVSILKDIVQLTIDTSGAGLHKRGYRVDTGDVPIRENLAAALVLLSFWNKNKILIDPMCGSGTILIEAAMIGRNIAPGLKRKFISEEWAVINNKFWEDERLCAIKVILPSGNLRIFGYDIDKKRIEGCKTNAKNAGVESDIIFKDQDIKDLEVEHENGMVISNPPYGVKMARESDLYYIYDSINAVFKNKPGWSIYIITSDKNFPKYFKRAKPDKVRKLYNGTIEVNYYQYQKK